MSPSGAGLMVSTGISGTRAAGGASAGEPQHFQYAAFISYSHSDGAELADRLHARLEGYRVPASLVGRRGPGGLIGRRLGKVFRDRAELGAHHDLGGEIREALDRSASLIVLCSPSAARSRYVSEEIRYFKSIGRGDRILAAIVSGEPHAAAKPGLSAEDECFPAALVNRLDEAGEVSGVPETTEPIAADFRDRKDGFESGFLKLVAGMLDIGLDDLVQREKQAERRRRLVANGIAGGMAMLALAAAGGGGLAWRNGQIATERARELAEVNAVLTQSKMEIESQNASLDRQLREITSLSRQMGSIVDEIVDIVGDAGKPDARTMDRLMFLSSGARVGMSAAAMDMIFELEFGAGDDPPAISVNEEFGVCVGSGYCLGRATEEAAVEALSGVMPKADVERLARVAGLTGSAARAAFPSVRSIKVSRRQAIRIFGETLLPEYAAMTRRAYAHVDELHPDAFGALVSVTYHSGSGPAKRLLGQLMEEGRFEEIPEAMRERGRQLAARLPRFGAQFLRRTEAEAALFEKGLSGARLQQPG